jgi:hypothetical protein
MDYADSSLGSNSSQSQVLVEQDDTSSGESPTEDEASSFVDQSSIGVGGSR